ncbi:MAG: SDR family oxidoreductase [Candidatus Lustribacter sp.]|jgi:NAD(P)-dependent dehydrogenase (short-subunit alcohol dehydrogenase family)
MNQRIAVVTGAGSGFGRLTAQALARAGWRVYATMRDPAGRNAPAAGELRPAGITVVELDVTSDASVDAAARTILGNGGSVDLLVNNAGTGYFGIEEAYTPAAAERQFATNVIGPLRVNRAFLPAMRERRSGLVVYVSSVAGRLVVPFGAIYGASKFALEVLAEASSYELAPFGVDVAIVEPGAYPTDILTGIVGADDAERVAAYGAVAHFAEQIASGLQESAAGRDPQEVADTIVRLAGLPAGERPLRTVVPGNPGVTAINAALAPIQREALKRMGLETLLPKASASK